MARTPTRPPKASALPSSLAAWLDSQGSETAFTALAELIPEAVVFAVDGQRNVIFWSAGAERILGFKASEVLGQHCLKSNRCQACMEGCGIAATGRVSDLPLVLHREDGTPVPVRKTARAFFGPDGSFQGGIEVLIPDKSQTVAAAPAFRSLAAYGVVTGDTGLQRAFEIVRNVAPSNVPVLLRGESGTGKELLARALHQESPRRAHPFLAINCAALSPALLESELFGHVKGAFTGAASDRPGMFTLADGGTLFLDEVAELPLDLQAKLLRVVQDGTFIPVGGQQVKQVDVRIVSATHRSLREQVRLGRFREDLMYRLRVVPIFLPPLRERRGDIELLLWHFIAQRNAGGQRAVRAVHPDALQALLRHPWPGNVREMQNVVDYAFAVGRGEELRLTDLPPEFQHGQIVGGTPPYPASQLAEPPQGLRYARAPLGDEPQRIADALVRAGGNVGEAARLLGMSRPTLWRKRRKFGL